MIFFFFLALVENENKCAHEDFGRIIASSLQMREKEQKQNWKEGNRFLNVSDKKLSDELYTFWLH